MLSVGEPLSANAYTLATDKLTQLSVRIGKMITQSQLKEVLDYNPKTGIFTWIKVHPNCPFPAGTIANSRREKGIRIHLSGKSFQAHKLVVLYIAGYYPSENVLHKDGDYFNNKQDNLIVATQAESCINRDNKKNTSGFKGVNFHKSSGKYEARLMINGKRKCLGTFDDPKLASECYQAYKKQQNLDKWEF